MLAVLMISKVHWCQLILHSHDELTTCLGDIFAKQLKSDWVLSDAGQCKKLTIAWAWELNSILACIDGVERCRISLPTNCCIGTH